MTTILDPTDERKPVHRELTPRPAEITGNVALLDISKPRGSVLLDRLEQRPWRCNATASRPLRSPHPNRCARRFCATMTLSLKRWLTEDPVPRAVCMTRYGLRFRVSLRFQLRAANSKMLLRHRRMPWA